MQQNTETQISGQLSNGDDSTVELGFLSTFFAVLTTLLALVFSSGT